MSICAILTEAEATRMQAFDKIRLAVKNINRYRPERTSRRCDIFFWRDVRQRFVLRREGWGERLRKVASVPPVTMTKMVLAQVHSHFARFKRKTSPPPTPAPPQLPARGDTFRGQRAARGVSTATSSSSHGAHRAACRRAPPV